MVVQEINKSYIPKVMFILFLLTVMLVLSYGVNSYRVFQGLRPLIRTIENKIVLYKTRDFEEIETDTFIFRYKDIDDNTLELIKNTAEDKYKKVTDVFRQI